MIRSFLHKGLERFFLTGSKKGIVPAHAARLRLQLARLDSAQCPGVKGRSMTRMHNPPHPGEVLRDGVFAEAGETVTAFARRLGVSRVALSRVLNGQAAISAEMALRLAAALGGTAESWLHMQASYDLWQARRVTRGKIQKILPVRRAA